MVKTRDLLLKIGHENNLPQDKILQIIEKLENEWYTEASTLQEISEAQWKTLNIPARIVGLIIKYLSEDPQLISKFRQSILSKLVSSLSSEKQDLINCISILQQIVYNLLVNPIPKYRTLKSNNPKFHQAVGRLPLGQEYLKLIGFKLLSEEWHIQIINEDFLSEVLSELNQIADNLGLPTKTLSKFNPFKSSVSCTNFEAPKLLAGDNDPIAITQEIHRIQRQRAEIVKKVSINRNPRVYSITEKSTVLIEDSPTDFDEEIMKKNIQSILAQRESSMNFQNKRKIQLEKLKSTEFIAKVVIKIRFPNGFLLEGSFSVNETVRDLYEFVRNSLENDGSFYLFTAPPKRVLKNTENKLVSFSPAAVFQFSWTDDNYSSDYLKRSLIR